jgi:hypothetical protein
VVVFFLLVNPAESLATPPPLTFLIASDLHFNPFADPTLVAALDAMRAAEPDPPLVMITGGSKH